MTPPDYIVKRIGRIHVKKVQIVLAHKKVQFGDPKSGLWPRVTLKLDSVERTFPFTYWAEIGTVTSRNGKIAAQQDYLEMGKAIMQISGIQAEPYYWHPGSKLPIRQQHAICNAVRLIRNKIRQVMRKTVKEKRVDRAQVIRRQTDILISIEHEFKEIIHCLDVKHGEVSAKDVALLWEQVTINSIVRDVHES
jgi:hypothetical protein